MDQYYILTHFPLVIPVGYRYFYFTSRSRFLHSVSRPQLFYSSSGQGICTSVFQRTYFLAF